MACPISLPEFVHMSGESSGPVTHSAPGNAGLAEMVSCAAEALTAGPVLALAIAAAGVAAAAIFAAWAARVDTPRRRY